METKDGTYDPGFDAIVAWVGRGAGVEDNSTGDIDYDTLGTPYCFELCDECGRWDAYANDGSAAWLLSMRDGCRCQYHWDLFDAVWEANRMIGAEKVNTFDADNPEY